MSFGFGVGDFIAVSELTLKLYKAFKGAPDEFLEISRELQSFYIVIADLKEQAEDPESLLNRYGTTRRDELITLRDNLISTMGELQELHEKYRRMGRISWSRVGLGTADVGAIRSKLTVQISALNAFIGSLSMATLSRMEPMLERILHVLDERVKRDLEVAQTVLSIRREGDEENNASWTMLEMELRTESIPSEYISENREQIMEVMDRVIELNLLEGDDRETIYADDSISQIGRHQGDQAERSRTPSSKVLTSQKQQPQSARYWSSKLKLSMRGTPSAPNATNTENLGPETTESQKLPLEDWVSQLSPEEQKTRVMLMNRGFDIQEIESDIASSSKPALFKGGSKSGSLSEKAICWAALNDEELAVRMLLERGCNPSSRHEGRNIAVLAAEAGKWDIVTLLIKSGTNIYAGYNTGLIRRDKGSDYWVPRRTYKGTSRTSDFKESQFVGEMGLIHIAANCNQCDTIALLLNLGTYVDIHMKSATKSLAKFLGSDLQEYLSWSALQIAIQKCSFEAVELLLKRGANANKLTYHGDHALKFSVRCKYKERRVDLVRLLLRYGADLNALDRYGKTLLFHATNLRLDYGQDHVITEKEKKRSVSLIQLLLDNGAKINAPDSNGTIPIHVASEEASWLQSLDIVYLLLEAGANVNARNKSQESPLRIATKTENIELMRLLLEKGAPANSQMDNYGYDLLSIAAKYEPEGPSYSVIKLLVDAGADISINSYYKKSIKDIAKASGKTYLFRYLDYLESIAAGN